MALEAEAETFRRELPGLLADPANHARFALIHGPTVAGLYPTADAAVAAGYDRFGLAPFLVRRVTEPEELPFFPRVLRCRS